MLRLCAGLREIVATLINPLRPWARFWSSVNNQYQHALTAWMLLLLGEASCAPTLVEQPGSTLCHLVCMYALQEVRKGLAEGREFRQLMWELMQELKARGPPDADDTSIAAHIMRIQATNCVMMK